MQLPEAEELVAKSKAKTTILLNAEWTDTKSVASRHGSFVASFETAYCFQPIAIQACPSLPLYSLPCLLIAKALPKLLKLDAWVCLPDLDMHNESKFMPSLPIMRCSTFASGQVCHSAQAFVVSTTQGALFAQATQAGSPASWQILKKGWGQSWKVIGRMQRRPTSQDLETAFYNASAAESPLTAGIRAVRQLVPGQKE